MKKEDFFWPIILGIIIGTIIYHFIGFQFFLAHPEYRWIVGVVVVGILILMVVLWYLIERINKR